MYTRQSDTGKVQEQAAGGVQPRLSITVSAHICSKIFVSSWSLPHPGTSPARGGAVPSAWTRHAAFTGVTPRVDISEGAPPRGFSSAHQIKRKTTWMTSANLAVAAPQRGFAFLGYTWWYVLLGEATTEEPVENYVECRTLPRPRFVPDATHVREKNGGIASGFLVSLYLRKSPPIGTPSRTVHATGAAEWLFLLIYVSSLV